ncbi:MAG TPA: efflux RND transporter periplasmic adaptor subunit [Thermoanaerobaculaceae bacterium]|nr:efflux RND transporter periplasmic adaptor subunit [Thermoanaerobaculaceae bacterium]HRS15834.1 efflux RND transporter periplasmic adaptor subunit [Thermoanaerobaculaceae bacterium]
MKTLIKVLVGLAVVAAMGYGAVQVAGGGRDKGSAWTLVKVERGTITDKALATGQIVPEQEIQVKSQISGIVKECLAEVGDRVEAGQPLFVITPDPTPLELNEVQRKLDLAEVTYAKAAADLERASSLWKEGILSREQLDGTQKAFDEARIQLDLARERLALTKEGRIRRATNAVDSVIRAPASGTVLRRHVNPGDPVVPLTSYQAGTPLATLADMGTLLFRGTVDEIDVGKLEEGMPVRIRIGALPDARVSGRLTRIAPKATEKEGTTLFDVEAAIAAATGVTLRAGYSANADIVIQEKNDALVIPERLVAFEGGKASVEMPPASAELQPIRREIRVGLSDGLLIEVLEGLADGDHVIQRPPKQIT